MTEQGENLQSRSTQARTSLDNIRISAAALSGAIYVGRTKKNQPGVWTDKRPAMGDGAERMLALHMKRGAPYRPGRKRPLYTCTLCGEHKRGVRGVMQHQNQFHGTQWPKRYILANQDPDKEVWFGYAVLAQPSHDQ
jgi:hypothetical protein